MMMAMSLSAITSGIGRSVTYLNFTRKDGVYECRLNYITGYGYIMGTWGVLIGYIVCMGYVLPRELNN